MCCLRFTWSSPGSSFSIKALTSFLLRESGLPSAPAYVSKVFIRMAMAVSSCVMVVGVGGVQNGVRHKSQGSGVEAQRGGKSFYTFRERDWFYRSGDSVFYQGGGSNYVNTAAIINRPGCVAFSSSLSFSCRTIDSKGVLILTRF